MTALNKLLRTTAFQLTLLYLLVFALFAAFLLGYFALNTRRLVNEQIVATVNDELQLLQGVYNQAGIRRLVGAIDVHISRLRSKIDKGFAQPLLHTVRGAGYMIRESRL